MGLKIVRPWGDPYFTWCVYLFHPQEHVGTKIPFEEHSLEVMLQIGGGYEVFMAGAYATFQGRCPEYPDERYWGEELAWQFYERVMRMPDIMMSRCNACGTAYCGRIPR